MYKLQGKRLIERRLLVQPSQVHFGWVFPVFCATVSFLDPSKSCDKLLCFVKISVSDVQVVASRASEKLPEHVKSVALGASEKLLEDVIEDVKSVASRAYSKLLEEVKSVASRAYSKLLEEVKSVASRAYWKLLEEVKSVASRASEKLLEEVKSVASRASEKLLEDVKSVASRATWKLLEDVKSVASRAYLEGTRTWRYYPTPPHPTPPRKSEKNIKKKAKELAAFYQPPANYKPWICKPYQSGCLCHTTGLST